MVLRLVLRFSFCSLFCASVLFARADLLQLQGGGTFEGEVLNPGEVPQLEYRVRSPEGVEIVLERSSVEKTEMIGTGHNRNVYNYLRMAPFAPDTVESHHNIAEWCKQRFMTEYAKEHWTRIIQLSPNDERARKSLGHTYSKTEREWKNPEIENDKKGMVRYEGRWRSTKEVELMRYSKSQGEDGNKWRQTIRRICANLHDPKAQAELAEIRSPQAARAIAEAVMNENNPGNKILLLRALSNIGTPGAFGEIIQNSFNLKNSPEVRTICFNLIREHPGSVESAGNFYASYLSSSSVEDIARGAQAIGNVGAKGQVPRLINALVTEHERKHVKGSGGMNASFNKDGSPGTNRSGGGGLSSGQSITTERYLEQNHEVLRVLNLLTGVDFGFDKARWREWLDNQSRAVTINPRRG